MDLANRSSGVLAHLTSLPGPHGTGDLGPTAYWFADWLAACRQSWWQMLPIGPLGYSASPYSASSAFAGNPLLISLEMLAGEDLLDPAEFEPLKQLPVQHVDYRLSRRLHEPPLRKAFQEFEKRQDPQESAQFGVFCDAQNGWLNDYALFMALKRSYHGAPWFHWSRDIRDRHATALEKAGQELAREVRYHQFLQYEFDRQWSGLRAHCRDRGIGLMGDVPIFVEHDSADVWSHRELFQLDQRGKPTAVAGVPPDYFSATGQRWGNPLYRWDVLREQGYNWWLDRLRFTLARFDSARLDHFIGFHHCWTIPVRSRTAESGRWIEGPGSDFFQAVQADLGGLPFVAEDLGLVTPEVAALREEFHLRGVRVLQFAFAGDPDDPDNPVDLPLTYPKRCVVYTGTHDNDTTVGWFHATAGDSTQSKAAITGERARALEYLGSDGHEIHWDMIRLAMMTPAALAIIPLQDLMGLGSEARMNRPGTTEGNWEWRFAASDLRDEIGQRLVQLAEAHGRVPKP
jgi:4-alpha-glucanotransferase